MRSTIHLTTIRATEAPRFELPGVGFTGLAAPSRRSADLCTWRLTVAPGHTSDQSHTVSRDEIFMVISGAILITPDAEPLGPGDATVVPAGERIQIVNPGTEPAEIHVAIPAGFTATMADGTPLGTPPWAA
jgi:mannose-6-phosphate isomerase-like protein (cupin superfamily)